MHQDHLFLGFTPDPSGIIALFWKGELQQQFIVVLSPIHKTGQRRTQGGDVMGPWGVRTPLS